MVSSSGRGFEVEGVEQQLSGSNLREHENKNHRVGGQSVEIGLELQLAVLIKDG